MNYTERDLAAAYQLGYSHGINKQPPLSNEQVPAYVRVTQPKELEDEQS